MIAGRTKMLRAMLLTLVLGCQLALSAPASAQESQGGGIGIFPVVIDLQDALRGAEYLRTFTVINREQADLDLQFAGDGEIGPWLTVHASTDQLDTTLDRISVPAESEARLILRVRVPADAANGSYSGGMIFQGAPAAGTDGESGMGVALGIAADIMVEVTGEQQLSGAVLDAWVEDAEVDQSPVRLRIQFQNDGNVQTSPLINWVIKDASGAEVGTVSQSPAVVQPGFVDQLVVEWDPAGQPDGEYTSVLSVQLGDEAIDERELGFELLPVGTLTRNGELDRITLEGEPEAGSLIKLVGYFRNTGQIDTRAVLAIEIQRDSELVKSITSLERVVVVGELALLEAVFEVPEAGDYVVSGKVNYEGKETGVQTLDFSALASPAAADAPQAASVEELAQSPSQSGSQSSTYWIVGGLALLVCVIALAFFIGRRRPAPAAAAPQYPVIEDRAPIEDRGQSVP